MTCGEYANPLVKTGVEKEVTWNTAADGTPDFLMIQQNSITESNVLESSRVQDGGREPTQVDLIQKLFRGNLVWKVQDALLLLSSFGKVTTTGAGPYVHTFEVEKTIPSYSIFQELIGRGTSSDEINYFTGCKNNSLTLDFAEKGILMATADVIAAGRSTATTKTITGDITTPFRFADIIAAEMTIDGNAVRLLSGQYKLLNNLSEQQAGETIAEQCPQQASHELTTTVRLSGTEVLARLRAADEVPVIILFTRGADLFKITAQATLREGPIDTGIEGPIETQLAWEVRTASIEVTNSVATYDY